jgi:hypothetical protein
MDNLKARGRGRCTRSVHDIIAVPQKAVVLHQTMWPYPVCARHTPSLRGINNTTNYTHTASGVESPDRSRIGADAKAASHTQRQRCAKAAHGREGAKGRALFCFLHCAAALETSQG